MCSREIEAGEGGLRKRGDMVADAGVLVVDGRDSARAEAEADNDGGERGTKTAVTAVARAAVATSRR